MSFLDSVGSEWLCGPDLYCCFACIFYVTLSVLTKLPEQYRLMHIQPPKKKNKHKHKHLRPQDPLPPGDGQTQTHKETTVCFLKP